MSENQEQNQEQNKEQNKGGQVKLATIADMNIRGVKYKIATEAFEGNKTERNLKAIILRQDKETNHFKIVTNNDECIAIWEQFKKLHQKGVEEGKIQVKQPTEFGMPNVSVKQTNKAVSEEELRELDAKRAEKKEN